MKDWKPEVGKKARTIPRGECEVIAIDDERKDAALIALCQPQVASDSRRNATPYRTNAVSTSALSLHTLLPAPSPAGFFFCI